MQSWMVHHGVVFPTVDVVTVGYSRTAPPGRKQAGSPTYASSGQGAWLVCRRLTTLLSSFPRDLFRMASPPAKVRFTSFFTHI